MNQGTIVAGGGGGSGDGDGSGGDGGDGEGGNGGNGGDDANGGGPGAGKCGQGSPGACTNCGHNVAAGDPVDVTSGAVFTLPATDLFLPGRFDFKLLRSYNSANKERDVGIGHGWCHGLAWTLTVKGTSLILVTGDGRQLELPAVKSTQGAVQYGRFTVVRGHDAYVVYPGDEFGHVFRPREAGSREFELGWVRYRNRGQLALEYDRGRLARVTDTVGRIVHFDAAPNGRIGRVSVAAPDGRRIDFAQYSYDSAGNLVSAVDADGHATQFGYDDAHRLTHLRYPNGLVFYFRYDRKGRCVETWGDHAAGGDPALDRDLPKLLADGRSRARGIFHSKLDFGRDGYTEVVDSQRVRRFSGVAGGLLGKAVGGKGNVTTREFDLDNNVLAMTDANEATWRWEYDRIGNVTRAIDPEGGELQIDRNVFGQELRIVDPEGGATAIERDASGEVVRVVFASGADNRFVVDEHGTQRGAYDAVGGNHDFELDGHANRVSHTYPNGARFGFAYDYWGRVIAETGPDGAERRYTYSDAGLRLSRTDRLGRTTRYEYDGMRNVTREVFPDGTTHEFEYGGLGWMCVSRWADGTEVRASYDREGHMVRLVNERGETYAYAYDLDGHLASDTDFAGRVTYYGHDPLGRITWIDRGRGKTHYVRNAVGLVVEAVAPDESTMTFEYDRRGLVVSATSQNDVKLTLVRDAMGAVTREEVTAGGQTTAIETERGPAGARRSLRTSLGHEVRALRDANDLVTELGANGERVLRISYDIAGRVVRRDFAGGGAILDERDAEGRLERRQVVGPGVQRGPGGPQWVGRGQPGTREWLFDYSPVGELNKLTESSGRDVMLEYDVRRRLTKRDDDGREERFAYDGASNVHERGTDSVHVPGRRYERGDVLVTRGETDYVYDDLGFPSARVARDASGAVTTTRYRWDEWGRLRAVDLAGGTCVEFEYDAFWRRVAKKTTRAGELVDWHRYVWDTTAVVHDVRLAASGDPTDDVTTFLYLDGNDVTPAAQRARNDAGWAFHVADFNGTPEELVDASGRTVGRLTRTAFGRMGATADSVTTTAFRFPGQMEDVETGLHYNRSRYYDPEVGRYLSPDPIGLAGGLNAYLYGVNPVGWTDLAGMQHGCTVTGDGVPLMNWTGMMDNNNRSPSTGEVGYHAGRGGETTPNPPLPGGDQHPLWPTAAGHSEQKFAQDLMTQANRNPGRFNGKNFNLAGSLPPCPVCHAAMMRAAQVSGANLTYTWGTPPRAITYAGTTGQPSVPSGLSQRGQQSSQSLLNAYQHQDAGNWGGGPQLVPGAYNPNSPASTINNPQCAYGYTIPPGAWSQYNRQK